MTPHHKHLVHRRLDTRPQKTGAALRLVQACGATLIPPITTDARGVVYPLKLRLDKEIA